jgi:hypothetical protein
LLIFTLLLAASIMSVMLARARMANSNTNDYSTLIWNLGLAWIPFVFASIAYLVSWYTLRSLRFQAGYIQSILTAENKSCQDESKSKPDQRREPVYFISPTKKINMATTPKTAMDMKIKMDEIFIGTPLD